MQKWARLSWNFQILARGPPKRDHVLARFRFDRRGDQWRAAANSAVCAAECIPTSRPDHSILQIVTPIYPKTAYIGTLRYIYTAVSGA